MDKEKEHEQGKALSSKHLRWNFDENGDRDGDASMERYRLSL